MKILFVTDQRYRSSGVSVFCVELCEALIKDGAYVRLALQRPDYPCPYAVKQEEMLTTINAVLDKKNKFEWDIVHINGVWNWPYHKVAKVAYKLGIPVVWSPHGSLSPWALNHKWFKKKIAWLLYMRRDLTKASILHVTANNEAEYMRRLGLKNEVAISPLGVKFRWSIEELREIKSTVKTKTIISVSRIHPVKGLDNLIKAWAHLKHSLGISGLLDWNVKIVGDESFPGYINYLKRLCLELDVESDFEFCSAVYGYEKDKVFAESRILVLPSHSENFGAVVSEALANGTPVITTKGTPWQGLVDNKCGWWIDVGVGPLVEVLQTSLKLTTEELREMGENGYKWMKRDYEWTVVASRMKSIYDKVARK